MVSLGPALLSLSILYTGLVLVIMPSAALHWPALPLLSLSLFLWSLMASYNKSISMLSLPRSRLILESGLLDTVWLGEEVNVTNVPLHHHPQPPSTLQPSGVVRIVFSLSRQITSTSVTSSYTR